MLPFWPTRLQSLLAHGALAVAFLTVHWAIRPCDPAQLWMLIFGFLPWLHSPVAALFVCPFLLLYLWLFLAMPRALSAVEPKSKVLFARIGAIALLVGWLTIGALWYYSERFTRSMLDGTVTLAEGRPTGLSS